MGVPDKGTPQGGILSPLLSNIVLNELDWWVASQWDTFKSSYEYTTDGARMRALKGTKLKEMFIVRYADDFKILCKSHGDAIKIKEATTKWLEKRLGLEISEEKSKITNLKRNYTEFLGIKIKVVSKGNKMVVRSHMTDKSLDKIICKLKGQIKRINKNTTQNNVNRYNAMVLGWHNYYGVATNVNIDFKRIYSLVRKYKYNLISIREGPKGLKTKTYMKYYGRYNYKTFNVRGIKLFPIRGVRTRPPMNFTNNICNYTQEGRELIHSKLSQVDNNIVKHIMRNPIETRSVEYNDNRISVYTSQKGKCRVTGKILELGYMECHHIIPIELGGSDKYSNLIYVSYDVHKLIHVEKPDTVQKYIEKVKPNKEQIELINKYRAKSGKIILR